MTKPLPKPNVQVAVKRTGPPRLTSAERQQLLSIEDPTLKKIMGEIFIAGRANQDNFDEISQWFPIQPADVADELRDQVAQVIEEQGDLIAGDEEGLPDRLPVGLPGEVLTVDPTASLGVDWHPIGIGLGYAYAATQPGVSGEMFLETEPSKNLYLTPKDFYGVDVSKYVAEWGASTNGTNRGYVLLRRSGESGVLSVYRITGEAQLIEGGGFAKRYKIPAELVLTSPLPFSFGDVVELYFFRAGDKGTDGEKGATGSEGRWASLKYTFSSKTEETEPATGNFKFNAGKTKLFIRETDADGGAIGSYLAAFDDSTSTVRGYLIFREIGTPAVFAIYEVNGALEDKGAWDVLPVALITSGGAFTDAKSYSVEFYRTGDKGAEGATGPPNGFPYTYDKASTTTTTTPSIGKFRFNKTKLSEATDVVFSATDSTGKTSTKESLKRLGYRSLLLIRGKTKPENFLLLEVRKLPGEIAGGGIRLSVVAVLEVGELEWGESESVFITILPASTPINGVVNTGGAGTIVRGEGFKIERTAVGKVTVTFTSAFVAIPTVTLGASGAGIVGVKINEEVEMTTSKFAAICLNVKGEPADGIFHFIATG